ncbi:unnamed protein product [Rotaria sordida]|uniref:DDE-1 domain-containing protein n=1 Tax=Rotaria sordida TaxID=392033 RepID=A0A819BG91_9BILA|nr:unnamed protein product [Rotaria sordida]
MPRTYVRKGKSYSTADLRGALNLIRDGKLTVKAALEQYHIPAATIYSRLSGLRGEGKPGAKTILSTDEEEFLIHVIHKYQEWQQPLTRSDLISIARTYMIELKKKNINNDSSLREWFFCFRQRWQNVIKLVQAYKLENIRSVSCTQTVVDRWFDHLEKVLTKLNLFDRPQSIYNVDETGFGDDPGRRQVIIKRNSKYGICTQGGAGKTYTTLIMCTSASGKFLPPYIIYRAQKLYDSWMPKISCRGTRFNATLSGWSEEITFFDWLRHHFVPAVKRIAELFKNHLLPAHCAGGFAKAGIYPFDKRVISKEKLLLSATASECNKSISESNTTDDIRDTSLTTTVVSHLQRTSSCPNFSSSDLPLISTHHTPSTSNNLGTSSGTVTSISSTVVDKSMYSTTMDTATANAPLPISTSDLDNISSTTTAISTFTPNTSTSSIFSAGMEVLYSNLDEPAFPESIYLQTAPSPNTASSHTNSTSRKNNNDNSWNFEGGTQTDKVENAQSSSISAANLGLSNRTALNAITAAINNHMKPTIMAINRRKKQVDRPYGESITSVDAYIKLSNKENARKRKSTKESAKANSKEKKE